MATTAEGRRTVADGDPDSLQHRVALLERELERARARERELAEREHDLQDFVENAVVGLHKVGPDGTILWANRADWELVGCTREEYVGHNIREFHADQDTLCAILAKLVGGGELREQSARLRAKDGTLREVLISSNAHMQDGRFVNTRCFTRDITALRKAEAAFEEVRNRMAEIVESSDDAILSVDMDGRILSWNRGAEIAYGFQREEVVGGPLRVIIPPEFLEEETEIFARVRDGERVEHYETVRVRKDGQRVDVSLTVSAIRDGKGALIGLSKVGRVITQQKQIQRLLADEARRKDEFLAILAHELRNPLAPIRYALSVASEGRHTPEQRQKADAIIARQVEQMARLLDDLLDVSRIARGHVELRKKTVDLTSIIGAAIDAARPLMDEKGHALEIDLPREALRLEADPVRLTQILSNLLTNAAKYTDPGGKIQLAAERCEGTVNITVRDNGMGIPPEMMPRLFTLFAQAATALKRAQGGLGIGLSLVKGFVEMHGGTVEARSEGTGRGSEFVVRLPVGAAVLEDRTPRPAKATGARRMRVLVADDNEDSALTCSMLFELWGHEVRVAHDGRSAVQAGEAFLPDIVFLDIGMPGMNGYEAARAIRASAWGKRTALVAVTGWGQEEDKQSAADAGFDHHLTKPVDPEKLQPLLASLT